MPIPKPTSDESKEDFISRCMGDSTMNSEFGDESQRSAVCYAQWEDKDKKEDKKLQTNIKTLSNYSRTEKYEGKDYLVLPAVLLTEGVHNNLYYPPEEISKFTGAWNNRPIPIQHPEENGAPISCNSPQVLCDCVGMVFNTRYEDGKLKAELWVDKDKISKKDRTTYLQLLSGKPIDISTGLWSDELSVRGDWNGESYTGIVQNIRPDHVALLPGQVGACSWKDGCGAPRINEEEENEFVESNVETVTEKPNKGFWESFKALFQSNRKSHEDIAEELQNLVKVPEGRCYNPVAVYNDHFIYNLECKENSSDFKVYKQEYQVLDDGHITLVNEAEELKAALISKKEQASLFEDALQKEEKEVELQTNVNKEEVKIMSKAIDKLINDERTQFSEEDREWLKTLDEDMLTKLSPVLEEKETVDDPKEEKEEEVEPTVNEETKEQIGLALSDVLASKEFAQAVAMAVKTLSQRDRKSQLVNNIVELKLDFTEDELYEMPDSALEKLVKVNSGDFSGRGGCGDQYHAEDNEPPEPPKILTKGKEDK
jgi:hypothetical protein